MTPKPRVETAALDAPGGHRRAEPPDTLVRDLAAWLGRSEPFVANLLAELGERFHA